jgi:hypothetical protein
MRTAVNALLLAVSVFSAAQPALAMGKPKSNPPPTWERLGHRWAFQLDEDGNRVALYDLAFPDLSGGSQVSLGNLDPSPEALDRVRDMIADGVAETSDAEMAEKGRQAISALAQLSSRSAGLTFPAGWWHAIPWKNPAMSRSPQAPMRFRVSDIRLADAVKEKAVYQKTIEALSNQSELGADFLDRFEFVRDQNGHYGLLYTPNGQGPAEGYRLASLEHPTERMWVAIGWDLVQEAIGLLIGQITIPVLGPIIGTATSRFFFYRQEVLRLHEEMAFEALNSAEEGAARFSPFAALSSGDRVKLAKSLVLGQSSWITAFQWVVRRPEREWRRELVKNREDSEASLTWLSERFEAAELLSPRYAMVRGIEGEQRLTMLARPRTFDFLRPAVAVDYAHPDRTRRYRIGIEVACVVVDFASRFIPYVGGIVYEAYYALVEKPVRTSQRWEARLGVHLEERNAIGGQEHWDYELQVIDRQRFNPFAIARSAERQLADSRWGRLSGR